MGTSLGRLTIAAIGQAQTALGGVANVLIWLGISASEKEAVITKIATPSQNL